MNYIANWMKILHGQAAGFAEQGNSRRELRRKTEHLLSHTAPEFLNAFTPDANVICKEDALADFPIDDMRPVVRLKRNRAGGGAGKSTRAQ